MKQLQTYVVNIPNCLKEGDGRRNFTWILLALFNSIRFRKDHRCLEGDRTLQTMQYCNRRKVNRELVQTHFCEGISNLKRSVVIFVRSLQLIGKREELFVGFHTTLEVHFKLMQLSSEN